MRQSTSKDHVYDAIIIGAGIAGLAAAKKLNDSGWDNKKEFFTIMDKGEMMTFTETTPHASL